MRFLQVGLFFVIALAWTASAQAQLFFRKTSANPSQRVPELILTIKTDPDDRKRTHAAEELREYDATTYTEIVPVLADVVKNDKKMSVRLEALNSLSRIRPVHPLAVSVIEKAAGEDESWRVRWQAKVALTKLQMSGFASKKADAPPVVAQKKAPNDAPTAGPNQFVVEVAPPDPAPRTPPFSPAAPTPLSPSENPTPAPPSKQGPSLFP